MAFLIDWPVMCNDSDAVFYEKLHQSRKARDHVLKAAPVVCPNAELVVVLQPRHPLEVSRYFCWIYSPSVGTYAYPIRNFRNNPDDQLGNAFGVLSVSMRSAKKYGE